MSNTCTDEAAFVQLPRAQPQTKAIVHQHFHPVRAFVDEEVRMMSTRFAKHIHHTGERFVHTGTHVERLHSKPGGIDPNHLINSRKSSAHSCAADAGHSTVTVPPRRRTLMRIEPPATFEVSDTGTKDGAPSIATAEPGPRIAMGVPLRSASLTQRRTTLAFSPRAKAIAAMDTPGCWHSPTVSALKRSLWLRRRRRPVPTSCPVVCTCTPIALIKRASWHH
jgi:hypothetical protein